MNIKRLIYTASALVMTSAALAQSATQQEWAIVGEAAGQTVLMQNVSFLLASDFDDTFCIVCKDGNLVNGVTKASFQKIDPSGIETPADNTRQWLMANDRLTLQGIDAATTACIYTADGREMIRSQLDSTHNTIGIGRLQPGIYVLRAGKAQVKFIKR